MHDLDDGLRTLLAPTRLSDDTVGQLRHAARFLARTPPEYAEAISCTSSVPLEQLDAFRDLACRLADENGLAVQVRFGNPASVHFFRRDALHHARANGHSPHGWRERFAWLRPGSRHP